MVAMFRACPGRPRAMLALRVARKVGRRGEDCREATRPSTAWTQRSSDSTSCGEREREGGREQ